MVTIVSDGGSLLQQLAETSQFGGGNAAYLDQLYEDWLRDPQSVSPQWRTWFQGLHGSGDVSHADAIARIVAAQQQGRRAATTPADDAHARKQAGVLRFLTAYRSRGHLAADLDPLAIAPKRPAPDLDLAFHGLSDADLDTEFDCGTFAGGGQRMKLRELRDRLRRTYVATIGAEFMHIIDGRGDRATAVLLRGHDACDRVGVGNVAGAAQALEPRAPFRCDRLRVAQPVLVQLIEISGVAAAELRSFRQLLQQTAAVTHDGHHGLVDRCRKVLSRTLRRTWFGAGPGQALRDRACSRSTRANGLSTPPVDGHRARSPAASPRPKIITV